MIPSSSPPFERLSARHEAYEANLSRAALWAHPSWFECMLGVDALTLTRWRVLLAQARESTLDSCSRAFVDAAGIEPPPPDSWGLPAFVDTANGRKLNLALLDMVPTELGIRVLCMRALVFRRFELRRLIDKRIRQRLSAFAGISLELLFANAPYAVNPINVKSMPPLNGVTAESLALEGLVLFRRDSHGSGAKHPPLLRLALARSTAQDRWLSALPDTADSDGGAWLYSQLPNWLGTWSWLFG
ncbi:type III secretion protein HrpB4 [Paraburkholderia humisilvae]|uniref:Type III secretion protein HrpB4 n=1 Tax=Paraburkholderia humisilvae TaxID=627669 RepID=A0A6J5F209_9BURK|nr:type III secretion protein HrpB4 [Paraburkholderia humisilvae]CAB3772870.1 hypothetical protein LMG29542_07004 [Paraburkholderia humisilvae]